MRLPGNYQTFGTLYGKSTFNDNIAQVVYTDKKNRLHTKSIKAKSNWSPPKLTILTDEDIECTVLSPQLGLRLFVDSDVRQDDWTQHDTVPNLLEYKWSADAKMFYNHKEPKYCIAKERFHSKGSQHILCQVGEAYMLKNANNEKQIVLITDFCGLTDKEKPFEPSRQVSFVHLIEFGYYIFAISDTMRFCLMCAVTENMSKVLNYEDKLL